MSMWRTIETDVGDEDFENDKHLKSYRPIDRNWN